MESDEPKEELFPDEFDEERSKELLLAKYKGRRMKRILNSNRAIFFIAGLVAGHLIHTFLL